MKRSEAAESWQNEIEVSRETKPTQGNGSSASYITDRTVRLSCLSTPPQLRSLTRYANAALGTARLFDSLFLGYAILIMRFLSVNCKGRRKLFHVMARMQSPSERTNLSSLLPFTFASLFIESTCILPSTLNKFLRKLVRHWHWFLAEMRECVGLGESDHHRAQIAVVVLIFVAFENCFSPAMHHKSCTFESVICFTLLRPLRGAACNVRGIHNWRYRFFKKPRKVYLYLYGDNVDKKLCHWLERRFDEATLKTKRRNENAI